MAGKKWSQQVTEHSDALDLARDVFTRDDPGSIARSLKRSAEHGKRRKGTPYQSAMSMLTFYINRAGDQLPAAAVASSRRPRSSCAPPSAAPGHPIRPSTSPKTVNWRVK